MNYPPAQVFHGQCMTQVEWNEWLTKWQVQDRHLPIVLDDLRPGDEVVTMARGQARAAVVTHRGVQGVWLEYTTPNALAQAGRRGKDPVVYRKTATAADIFVARRRAA